jgi:iron-sulfur cluster assembly accessory protein
MEIAMRVLPNRAFFLTPTASYARTATLVISLFAAAANAADTKPSTIPASQPAVPLIRLTPAAAKQILSVIKSQALHLPYLRVGVKSDNGNFTYILDITENSPAADDAITPDQGINIVVDRKSGSYLAGTVIDFKDSPATTTSPAAKGFVFRNPNAVEK